MTVGDDARRAAVRDFLGRTMPGVLDDLVVRCPDGDPPEQQSAVPGARIDSVYQNPFEGLCACLVCTELLTPRNPHEVLIGSQHCSAHLDRVLTDDKLDAWLLRARPKWSCFEAWLWHFHRLSAGYWRWPVPYGPEPFEPCDGFRPLMPALERLGYLDVADDLAAWSPKFAPLTRQTVMSADWGDAAEVFHDD
ncbi:MAG: hypothetical protein AAGE80_09865 [Pseudomonadota bacterium]